jgi:hypothetical protein
MDPRVPATYVKQVDPTVPEPQMGPEFMVTVGPLQVITPKSRLKAIADTAAGAIAATIAEMVW